MGRPIAAVPVLFLIIVICCVGTPIVSMALGGERHLRFLVYGFFQGCVWSWLICLMCRNHKVLCCIFSAIMFIILLLETFHYILLEHVVDYDTLKLLLNTNQAEIKGFFLHFFNVKVVIGIMLCLITVIALSLAVNICNKKISPFLSHHKAGLGIFITVSMIPGFWGIGKMLTVLFQQEYQQIVIWQVQGDENPELANGVRVLFSDPIIKGIAIYKTVTLERSNIDGWSALQYSLSERDGVAVDTIEPIDSLDIVVVIGESFIRSHSSLYGYSLPVNPCLEKERDEGALTVFSDAISPANFTVLSISNLLNLNSVSAGENWWSAASWPMLFSKAGWSVNVFTNQYAPGQSGDLEPLFFHPLVSGSNGGCHNTFMRRYDGEFISEISRQQKNSTNKSAHILTIWQLRGQHFPPAIQFPESARHPFTSDDIPADKPWLTPERRQIVADYANATLYNDSILGSIIDLYRSRAAVLIYFSDHGEEMWDSAPFGNRNRQRPEDKAWMRRQHDIPMMVWVSKSLQKRNPELVESIRAAAGKPVTTDHIGHTLLNIGGIRTPYYREELDVLSPGYEPVARKTASGYRYD